MEHYFHCLKSVTFNQSLSVSMARKEADKQLAVRIKDPGLRAWLLMNMRQDPVTKEIGWRINIDGIHEALVAISSEGLLVEALVQQSLIFNFEPACTCKLCH